MRICDDYSPADAAFNGASGEATLFRVRISVGQKSFTVTTPVDFGSQTPGGPSLQGLTVSNTSFVPLSRLRWAALLPVVTGVTPEVSKKKGE